MRVTNTPSPIRVETPPDGEASPAPEKPAQPETSEHTPQAAPAGLDVEAQLEKMRVGRNAHLFALTPPDAKLRQPNAKAVSGLAGELDKVRKGLDAAKGKPEAEQEKARAAVDEVLQKVVKAYGIGQDGVTGLEFDPKLEHQGGSIGNPRTFIVIGNAGLDSPAELASTILHESSHVQRNKQLADAGIDRERLCPVAQAAYEAMIEAEGCHREIVNAKKLGTSADYVKGTQQLKKQHLSELERFGGKAWRELAEKGQFDKLHGKFRQQQLSKK